MKAPDLVTQNTHVRLIEPNVERDAPISVMWLDGELGRSTLKLMGVPDKDNHASDLEKEKERVEEFLETTEQLNWAIAYDDSVVGAIWVDLIEKEGVPAPSVHIMIGEPSMRGKGVGSASVKAVIDYLNDQGELQVFSRHLADNTAATTLLKDMGFEPVGTPQTDQDGLVWQNVQLDLVD